MSKATDFIWKEGSAEPHVGRRREILAKHPEIEQLYGTDWKTFPQVTAVVVTQLALAVYFGNYVTSMPFFLAAAWGVGGVLTANIFLANHELCHNLVFEKVWKNRVLGILINFPIGVPFSVAFKKYHLEHHLCQGFDQLDTDIPTHSEASIFKTNFLTKLLWVSSQLLFYAVRPLFVRPKPMNRWEALNVVTQLAFDAIFIHYAGMRSFSFLVASTLLGGGLHPISGHFISEHYSFNPNQETYSCYSPLNALIYNVGYHNEHHDFPKVPGSRLYRIREIAPEYYDTLDYHTSWTWVIFRYITDSNVGPFSRTKRNRVAGNAAKSE